MLTVMVSAITTQAATREQVIVMLIKTASAIIKKRKAELATEEELALALGVDKQVEEETLQGFL